MSIRIHIERLVVDDLLLSHEDGFMLQAAVQSELARLLMERDWQPPTNSAHLRRLNADPIQMASMSDASSLGRQIASAVHGGLNQ